MTMKMKPKAPAVHCSPVAEADSLYPNERLKAVSLQGMGTIQGVRENSCEIASIPWMQRSNVPILERRRELFQQERFDRTNSEQVEELKSLLKSASSDPRMAAEVAAYQMFELTNDVMAVPFANVAFQGVNLSADEQAMIIRPRSKNTQRFTVRSQSLDGGSRSAQWRGIATAEQIDMEMLATDKVEYSLMDLQIGNISSFDDINQALMYDMEMKIDSISLANIDSLETSSGLRALLSIHPSVVAANIPDKNYLDLKSTSYGTAHKLTLPRIKEILNHIALFGAADPTQALAISSFVISPQNIRDSWDYTDLVSGWDSTGTFGEAKPSETVPTQVREQIFQGGMMTSAWGFNWSWLPNSQLDAGRMYVFTNQPVGWMFTKSELDTVIKWDASNSPTHMEYNIGEVMWRKAVRFYMPDLWKYRVVIIDF